MFIIFIISFLIYQNKTNSVWTYQEGFWIMQQITPVILCGGSGSRLWPLSRKSYPKQFVPLVGDKTLFQNSSERLTGPQFKNPVIVTNSLF